MLKPAALDKEDILAIDRGYIDYERFEELTKKGVVYGTKMKKNLRYTILSDTMYQTPEGLMEIRIQHVTFTKELKEKGTVIHHGRIITYADERKHKLIRLLTNDMESDLSEIIAIYRKRWEIELLFKLIKQNFPLKYFYGESANAIKIQIWVTLIANLLLTLMRKGLTRLWSFSRLATINVLCGFLQPVQPSGKGLGGHTESSIGRTDTVGTFHIEGMDRKVKGVNHDGIRHGVFPAMILKFYRTLIILNECP